MSKIKNAIFTALALAPTCSMAAFHQFVEADMPVGINEIKVDAYQASTVLASYITNDSDDGPLLNVNVITRGSDGFALREVRALPVNSVITDVEMTSAAVLSISHDENGYYHLLSAQHCTENSECSENELYLVNTNAESQASSFSRVSMNGCGQNLTLLSKEQGVGVASSCGVVRWFDETLTLMSETQLTAYPDEAQLQAKTDPWIKNGEDDIATPTQETFVFGALTEEGGILSYITWEVDHSGNIIERSSTSLEGQTIECQLLASESTKGAVCFDGNAFRLYPLTSDNSISLDVFVPEESTIYTDGDWSAAASNSHVYVHYQVISDSTNEASQIVSNIDAGTGEMYAYHSTTSSLSDRTGELPRYALSADALTAVTTYIDNDGNVDVSVYADLFTVTAPYAFNVNGIQVLTGQETSVPLSYQSESHLPIEIGVSSESQADWINVDTESKEIIFSPKHVDAGIGEYIVSLSTGDTERSQTLQATAILDPLSLHVFEPVIFENAELEGAVPLLSLIDAVDHITLLEDEVRTFTFSVENREVEEYVLEIESLPDFMSWSAETMELTVSPSQKDVGIATAVLTSADVYLEDDDDATENYNMSFNVLEIDEPPVITSTPAASVTVGDEYRYAMTFDDEETASSSLNVSLEVGPAWLSYNQSDQVLSGVPSDLYIGSSRVQITVSDTVGNIVVHSFTLTVNEDPDAESEGGSMGGVLALLIGGIIYRRFKERAKFAA
ncbi:MAG: hypothetical protein CBC55_05145 [Gammaproteobacteria bacterium TMED95]|nr:MAG: hypothetical protein CBC55_05145 [Gammaproteobacteria bacterium TMED95]|tara:strand:+ start:1070 stop:3265 length:2196 start_codon:yes stop_codon:yes gene_type:complete